MFLKKDKKSNTHIGKLLKISKKVVKRWFERYQRTNRVDEIHKSGRPTRISESLRRSMIRESAKDSTKTATEITNKLFHLNLSNSTTKGILSNRGFNAYRPAVKPYLSISYACDRKAWAWEAKNFSLFF